MKLIFIVSTILFFTQALHINAQQSRGTIIEGLVMRSEVMVKDINYAIYLPPGYDQSKRFYPVVYLLHGYTDNESAWIQFGEVHLTADRAISGRSIPPMIIVMPDAGVSWYINDYMENVKYEDMFFEEFIPYIERSFRIRSDKEFRAVAGLSMGGYGSLIWSLRHPDMFSSCVAFSASIRREETFEKMPEKFYNKIFRDIYGQDKRKKRITNHWKKNSVFTLMNELNPRDIQQVRMMLHCGDDDNLSIENGYLHNLMRNRNIEHEYRIMDGKHSWEYWRKYIYEGLVFIGEGFNR